MKKSLWIAFILIVCQTIFAQDSTFLKLAKQNTFQFEIAGDKMQGSGADFLLKEYAQSQFVILGEYHDSPQISKFTKSTIYSLDSLGFGTMALEVGKHGLEYLLDYVYQTDSLKSAKGISSFHKEFGYYDVDDYRFPALPFFDHKEDAAFLDALLDRKWNIIGLDQEYVDGMVPLMHALYNNMDSLTQLGWAKHHGTLVDSIKSYQLQTLNSGFQYFKTLTEDKNYIAFMEVASGFEKNVAIIQDIEKSIDIYTLARPRGLYYTAFSTRLKHFKENLRREWKKINFDLHSDKMLLKFGSLHGAKGTSAYDCQDMGSTLSEMADFNGTQSLHLFITSRFYEEDGELTDYALDKKSPFRDLVALGDKDKWTVIDLRVFRERGLFYPMAYNMSKEIKQLIISYDLMLVPPMDYEGKKL